MRMPGNIPAKKPRYRDLTYFGEQQLGNFILTDQRILFLRKTSMARIFGAATLEMAGFLAGLPAAIIAGHMAGARMESAKIKPDEVEKVLKEDPESTIIPLDPNDFKVNFYHFSEFRIIEAEPPYVDVEIMSSLDIGWTALVRFKVVEEPKNRQNLKAERLDCLYRQDVSQVFIRKYLLFSRRPLLHH